MALQEFQEPSRELRIGRVLPHRKRLHRLRILFGQGNHLEKIPVRRNVHLVDDDGVKTPGSHLVDEEIGGGNLHDHILPHALEQASLAKHRVGHESESALFGVTEPDSKPRPCEVREGLDSGGIPARHGDDDGRLGEKHGLGKLFRHGRDKADITGVIDVRKLRIGGIAHGLHGRTENSAAVVDGGQVDTLATGEFLKDGFDRGTIDPSAVEDERGFLDPGVSAGRSKTVFLEDFPSPIGSSQVAGKTERSRGSLTNRQDSR